MGWIVAIFVAPILLAIVATYIVLRLGLLLIRLMFAPALLLRR
jgi:hypothetical protein